VKLFVDANTLVSGLVFAGNERLLLEIARYGACELIANRYVRREVVEVLARPGLGLSEEEQRRLIALLDRSTSTVDDPSVEKMRDSKDRLRGEEDLPVLVGFETSDCDYLVTGDRELRNATTKAITTRRALEELLGEFE